MLLVDPGWGDKKLDLLIKFIFVTLILNIIKFLLTCVSSSSFSSSTKVHNNAESPTRLLSIVFIHSINNVYNLHIHIYHPYYYCGDVYQQCV